MFLNRCMYRWNDAKDVSMRRAEMPQIMHCEYTVLKPWLSRCSDTSMSSCITSPGSRQTSPEMACHAEARIAMFEPNSST